MQRVKFLGHIITQDGKPLSDDRIGAIQTMPKPVTKKWMIGFLGMMGYCRQWIPDYANLAQPQQDITHGHGLTLTDSVTWTTEAIAAFGRLKQTLMVSTTLGLLDHTQPFTQTVGERNGNMTSELLQEYGGNMRTIGYHTVWR